MIDNKIIKYIKEALTASQKKTSAYDTMATVKRIEGNTAWVHIPGGVDETPVELTIAAKAGDTVQVRVSGHRAWITGNSTAPPTDDKKAAEAAELARKASEENYSTRILALKAGEDAVIAIKSANGKNTVYHAASAPTGDEYKVGDTWFNSSEGYAIYSWSGSEWVKEEIGTDAIANLAIVNAKIADGTIQSAKIATLDAGKITSGTIDTNRLDVQDIISTGSIAIVSQIPTTVAELTDASDYAQTDDAVSEEQLIYKQAVSGTTQMSGTTTWVTTTSESVSSDTTGLTPVWTLKRPTYRSKYPVIFVAKQKKMVDGTITCSTPMIDDTLTVIDGGHITTGQIDAARINTAGLTIGESQVTGLVTDLAGKANAADLADKADSDEVVKKNLVKTGYWDAYFAQSPADWTKEANAALSYDPDTDLMKISCTSSYYGLTQAITVETNTWYVISAEVGSTFLLGFGPQQYPSDTGSWQTAADGRKYKVVGSGNNTTMRVYAYANAQTCPDCYINRIKVEKGDTYTGWYADDEQNVSRYVTYVDPSNGVRVYSGPGQPNNYTQQNSNGFTIHKDVSGNDTEVASFSDGLIELGKNSAYSEINLCAGLAKWFVDNANTGEPMQLVTEKTYDVYHALQTISTIVQIIASNKLGSTTKRAVISINASAKDDYTEVDVTADVLYASGHIMTPRGTVYEQPGTLSLTQPTLSGATLSAGGYYREGRHIYVHMRLKLSTELSAGSHVTVSTVMPKALYDGAVLGCGIGYLGGGSARVSAAGNLIITAPSDSSVKTTTTVCVQGVYIADGLY